MVPATCVAIPLLAALSSLAAAESQPAVAVEYAFRDFVATYERNYTDQTEGERRYAIFKDNYAFIQAENAKEDHWYTLGVNEFTDLSTEEFESTHLGLSAPESEELWGGLPSLGFHNHSEVNGTVPNYVDWVRRGKVTGVKRQGGCGACWAFSSTGAIEGAWAIATNRLVSLSEQQLLNCAPSQGCRGGTMPSSFSYLRNQGICSERSYPYRGRKQYCRVRCSPAIPRGGLVGYRSVPSQHEYSLMTAVYQQPVSIALEARNFIHHYRGGIINGGCGTRVNHGVLAVGYGTYGRRFYWKIKNSWGSWWGEHGYFRIKRGCICGMCQRGSYPVMRRMVEEDQELLV